jgi:hypothetical protein
MKKINIEILVLVAVVLFGTNLAVAQDYPSADVSVETIAITQTTTRLNSSITIKNTNDDDASKIVVTIVLPFNTIVTRMPGTCQAVPNPSGWNPPVQGYVRCTLASLGVNATHSFAIQTTRPPAQFAKRFSAFVVSEVPDPNSANNFATNVIP